MSEYIVLDLTHEDTEASERPLDRVELGPLKPPVTLLNFSTENIFALNEFACEEHGRSFIELAEEDPEEAYQFLRGIISEPEGPDTEPLLPSFLTAPIDIRIQTVDMSEGAGEPTVYEVVRFLVEPPNLAA